MISSTLFFLYNCKPPNLIKYCFSLSDQSNNKEPPVSTSSLASSTESASSSSSSSYSAPITATVPITTTYIQYAIDPKTNSQVLFKITALQDL